MSERTRPNCAKTTEVYRSYTISIERYGEQFEHIYVEAPGGHQFGANCVDSAKAFIDAREARKACCLERLP